MIWSVILWGLAALAAAAYGLRHAGRAGPPGAVAGRAAVKTVAVAALAAAGSVAGAPGLVVTGLALGAAGDLFLALRGERAFLAGMAAFALGHLAYAAWMFSPDGLPAAAPVIGLLALFGISTEVWLAPRTGTLRWPVRGYVVVILLMMAAAASLPPWRWPVVAGAVLFLLSDLILALELFVLRDAARKAAAGRLLWPVYWSGQALILAGSLAVP